MTTSARRPLLLSALAATLQLAGSRNAHADGFCHEDAECSGSDVCIAGTCRAPCEDDGDCGADTACVGGGCMAALSVPYAFDYGLGDDDESPACEVAADCNGSAIACHTASGQCRQFTTLSDGSFEDWRTCHIESPDGDDIKTVDGFCTLVGGYTCEESGDEAHCVGPSCTSDADCLDQWPLPSSLDCISGRCTNDCTTDGDCCGGSCCGAGGECAPRAQDDCVDISLRTDGGVCAAEVRNATLVPVWVTADPTAADNVVFLSEGFEDEDRLQNYELFVLRGIQYLTTRADLHNALMRNTFNIFLMRLEDRARGYDEATLFGWHSAFESKTQGDLSTNTQALFVARQGIAAYADSIGSTGTPMEALPIQTALIIFDETNGRARAGGGTILLQFDGGGSVPGLVTNPDSVEDRYFVMNHEMGHRYGTSDEYVGDAGTASSCDLLSGACGGHNVIPRAFVNPSCASCGTPEVDQCDGDHDGAWMPDPGNEPAWRADMNVSIPGDLPTGDSSFGVVGLYNGASGGYNTEMMRPQNDCVMRQGGEDRYCTACSHFAAHAELSGSGGLARLLNVDDCVQASGQTGLGPHRAVGVSEADGRAFMTRSIAGSTELLVLDTRVMRHWETVGLNAALDGADIPERILVDEAGGRALMKAVHDDIADNGIVSYDISSGEASRVDVAGLDVPFVVNELGRMYATRIEEVDSDIEWDLLRFDLSADPLVAEDLDLPTQPALINAPEWAVDHGLLFYPVGQETVLQAACGLTTCEIRVFDTNAEAFLDPPLTVDITPEPRGIRNALVAHPDAGSLLPGEVFIVTTEREVTIWDVADVAAGVTTSLAAWEHDRGAAPSTDVNAMAYSRATNTVWIGNSAGELAFFGALGLNAPSGTGVTIPGLGSNMEVRQLISTDDGTIFAALGGFSGPRDGLLLIIDAATGDIVRSTPLAALGAAGEAMAIDDSRQLLFTTGIVDSGDRVLGTLDENNCGLLGGPYKIPIFVTPTYEYQSHGRGACGSW